MGAGLFLTMTINIISPHAAGLVGAFVLGPLTRCKGKYGGASGFLAQFQMDEAFAPPAFKLEERSAQMLNTIAVTLAFCPGLPILLPIATVSLTLAYAVDKYLIVKFYRRPPPYNSKLPEKVLSILPYIVMLHLCNALWLYGEAEIFDSSTWMDPAVAAEPEAKAAYEESVQEAMDQHELLAPIIMRVTRTNTLPLFVLLVVLVGLAVIYGVVGPVVGLLLMASPWKEEAVKEQLAEQEFNPPYTEPYERWFPPTWDWRKRELVPTLPPDLPEARGWRKELKDGAYCLYKVETEKPSGGGVAVPTGAKKRTFEVVSENGLCSYQMRQNELYQDVIMARDSLLAGMGVEGGAGGGSGKKGGKESRVVPVF